MNGASIAPGCRTGPGKRAILRIVSEFHLETDPFARWCIESRLSPFDGTQSAAISATSVIGRLSCSGYTLIYLNRERPRFGATEKLFAQICLWYPATVVLLERSVSIGFFLDIAGIGE
jgi:hypothetical protein